MSISAAPASSIALGAIRNALGDFARSAHEVASASPDGDAARLGEALLEARSQQHLVAAAADVIRSEDQMLGSLLDVFA